MVCVWDAFYSTFRIQYKIERVPTLFLFLRTFICIDTPCWTTQPTRSKWLKMKLLSIGFQWCIAGKLNVSIRVAMDIYRFGGYFWGTPQKMVLIPTVDVELRTPWCPTQATRPKWLKMKPLNRGFQRCIHLALCGEYWDCIGGARCMILAIVG